MLCWGQPARPPLTPGEDGREGKTTCRALSTLAAPQEGVHLSTPDFTFISPTATLPSRTKAWDRWTPGLTEVPCTAAHRLGVPNKLGRCGPSWSSGGAAGGAQAGKPGRGEGSRVPCPGLCAHSTLGIISLNPHNHMSLPLSCPFHRGGNQGSGEPRLGAGPSESEACVLLPWRVKPGFKSAQGQCQAQGCLVSLVTMTREPSPRRLLRPVYLLPLCSHSKPVPGPARSLNPFARSAADLTEHFLMH